MRIYFLYDYRNLKELKGGVKLYFEFYNTEWYHQFLNYQTPDEVYFSEEEKKEQFNLSQKEKKK